MELSFWSGLPSGVSNDLEWAINWAFIYIYICLYIFIMILNSVDSTVKLSTQCATTVKKKQILCSGSLEKELIIKQPKLMSYHNSIAHLHLDNCI